MACCFPKTSPRAPAGAQKFMNAYHPRRARLQRRAQGRQARGSTRRVISILTEYTKSRTASTSRTWCRSRSNPNGHVNDAACKNDLTFFPSAGWSSGKAPRRPGDPQLLRRRGGARARAVQAQTLTRTSGETNNQTMITHEQNEYCAAPSRHADGRTVPPLLDSGADGGGTAAPNCPPVQVQLLGERLIAFRDTQGRLGLMDEFCAHRGVSLWFGRNEENGLRCPYHGWKYDVTGQCVDVPSEPATSGFCQKIKLEAYPCVEIGGVIWAYMGPPAEQPPAPDFEWVHLKPSQRFLSSAGRRAIGCRRWRAASIRATSRSCIAAISTRPAAQEHRRRELHAQHQHRFDIPGSPGGLLIGARRNADPGYHYWRITQWLMPWYTLIPPYKGNAPTAMPGCRWTIQLHGLDHDLPSGARPRPTTS